MTAAHKQKARTFFLENAAMNAAKRKSEAERKALFAELERAGIAEFSFATTDSEGKKVRLEVKVETPAAESIDVAILRTLVDDATFMRIVSASKKAVQEEAGKSVEVRATVSGEGTRNVFVKPAK